MTERVGAESADAGQAEREVDLAVLVQLGELAIVEQRVHHPVDVLGAEHRHVLERHQHAVAARRGRPTHREVEVGRTGVDGGLEQ